MRQVGVSFRLDSFVAAMVLLASSSCATDGSSSDTGSALVAHLRNMSRSAGRNHLPTPKPDEQSTTADPDDITGDKASDDWLSGKMWWEGPGVCLNQAGNQNQSSNPTTKPPITNNSKPREVDGTVEQNVLTLCHVERDTRICRSLHSTNRTQVEESLTIYHCCAGFELVDNECTAVDGAKDNGTIKKGSRDAVDQSLQAFFQQVLEGSIRSSAAMARALNSDAFENDEADRAMMPVVFIRGKDLSQNLHQQANTSTSPDETVEKTRSDLHLSLTL